MNIFLVPHTAFRHVAVAFLTGAVPLVIWWFLLNWQVVLGPWLFQAGLLWDPMFEGTILFSLMAGAIAWVHISAECGLRRRAIAWKILLPFLAALFSFLLTGVLVFANAVLTPLIVGLIDPSLGEILADPSTATYRFRLLDWIFAGTMISVFTLLVRVGWGFVGGLSPYIPESIAAVFEVPAQPAKVGLWMSLEHLLAGPSAALIGAAVWHILSHIVIKDMYLATALGFTSFGFCFGLIAWGVPSDLYAGWIRVLSSHRFGHRIPIDTPEGGVVERVVGHYPRGLDLWIGAEHGVAELHASFVRATDGAYTVRGLSQHPIKLKRALESVDLSYEPTSPVPLETDLRMEDRVMIGPKKQQTIVEFIMLPKEER
ncbi:MAG: hypothetical protein EA397_15340 [Deltaproteobacteria bacterium]|nr:MAG: hypothetical protein EA397_15340 [Deltaproteobacteria bacterium]